MHALRITNSFSDIFCMNFENIAKFLAIVENTGRGNYLLSLECVGNFGKKAANIAATDSGLVLRVYRPPPRKRRPKDMCKAMCDPYVTVECLLGPTLDLRNLTKRITSRSPEPAMTEKKIKICYKTS